MVQRRHDRRPSARSRNSAAARPRMGVGATVISQCRACKGCCCRPLGSWHSSTLGGHEHRFNRGRYCSVGGLQSLPLSLGDGVVTNSLEPRLLWNGIEGLDGPTAPGLLALSRGIDTGCGQRGRASRALDLASFRIRRLTGSGNSNGRYLAVLLKPNPINPRRVSCSQAQPKIACSTGSHVWPGSPIFGRDRDQARLFHPAGAAHPQHPSQLERSPDRPASGRPL